MTYVCVCTQHIHVSSLWTMFAVIYAFIVIDRRHFLLLKQFCHTFDFAGKSCKKKLHFFLKSIMTAISCAMIS